MYQNVTQPQYYYYAPNTTVNQQNTVCKSVANNQSQISNNNQITTAPTNTQQFVQQIQYQQPIANQMQQTQQPNRELSLLEILSLEDCSSYMVYGNKPEVNSTQVNVATLTPSSSPESFNQYNQSVILTQPQQLQQPQQSQQQQQEYDPSFKILSDKFFSDMNLVSFYTNYQPYYVNN
jgi:hypothetical protein